jgi:hypothetical protein
MTRIAKKTLIVTLAGVIGIGCLFLNDNVSLTRSKGFVTSAEAVIGRPLTPMSYAGVARRTTRRAVAVGAATAPVAAARRCVQAVDAYGRIYTRCY